MTIQACRLQNAAWPTILCIDDDPQIAETIALRLNQYEVNMLSACHGMHGFWLAMTNRPNDQSPECDRHRRRHAAGRRRIRRRLSAAQLRHTRHPDHRPDRTARFAARKSSTAWRRQRGPDEASPLRQVARNITQV